MFNVSGPFEVLNVECNKLKAIITNKLAGTAMPFKISPQCLDYSPHICATYVVCPAPNSHHNNPL